MAYRADLTTPLLRGGTIAKASARVSSKVPWRAMMAQACSKSPSCWSPLAMVRCQKARSSTSARAKARMMGKVTLRFAEIVADALADIVTRAAEIQKIINHLKAYAQRVPISEPAPAPCPSGAPASTCARFSCRRKQRRRLAPDHAQVLRFGRAKVLCGGPVAAPRPLQSWQRRSTEMSNTRSDPQATNKLERTGKTDNRPPAQRICCPITDWPWPDPRRCALSSTTSSCSSVAV